jgi:hypothetical protein
LEFNPVNGDIYLAFLNAQSALSIDLGAPSFSTTIWKLDANLNSVGLFSYGATGQSTHTKLLSLHLDSTAGNIFASGISKIISGGTSPNQIIAKIECKNHSISLAKAIVSSSVSSPYVDVFNSLVEVSPTFLYTFTPVYLWNAYSNYD